MTGTPHNACLQVVPQTTGGLPGHASQGTRCVHEIPISNDGCHGQGMCTDYASIMFRDALVKSQPALTNAKGLIICTHYVLKGALPGGGKELVFYCSGL